MWNSGYRRDTPSPPACVPIGQSQTRVPIAKERGIAQLVMSGPERIFDIKIVSKVPLSFARVMFAPAILAGMSDLADYFKKEITGLRLIARDAAITAELWIRSKHGTWRFFLVTPNTLVEIDRQENRLVSLQTVSYTTGALVWGEGSSPS